jgi:hypothetical protein
MSSMGALTLGAQEDVMNIEIKRCFYGHDIRQEAVSLSRELEQALKVLPRIRWGGPGRLDVLVDGRRVFSRRATGRMPKPGEISNLVRSLQAVGRGGC